MQFIFGGDYLFRIGTIGVMISIVGFGRPKFGSTGKASATKSAPSSKNKKCESCGQEIK